MKINFDFLKRKDTQKAPSVSSENVLSVLKRKIEIIEKAQLGSWDKASLVLLQLDRKKVADIAVRKVYTTPEDLQQTKHRFEAQIQSVQALANSLDLKIYTAGVQTEKIGDTNFLYFIIFLAKDVKYLDQEKIANKNGDKATIGKLRGYPDTSAEWYARMIKSAVGPAEFNSFVMALRGQGLEQSEVQRLAEEKFPYLKEPAGSQEVVEMEGLDDFLHFRLSPDHWREELNVVRQNKDAIRTNAPQLYAELIAERK